ncbi:MAG TPA: tRNA (adenosine(37)-N6)-dimethylallyltransferase MiaA [Bacilli bacterium]|nr:tRNA (adenosine(37)-N6)-dimethylallyltransferase MiaA [Bacilli bacterium]
MSKIIVIVGPTASGKSALATLCARKFNGAIISADSMQIYRGLDIGTAKEKNTIREEIPHYMLDIADFDEEFSVAQFKNSASKAIEDIENSGKIPIVVGGTGLYIEALLYPFTFSNASKDLSIRKTLEYEYKLNGSDFLYEKLKTIDSETAEKLHPNDIKRIIRALEIFYTTGKTKSESKDEGKICAYDVVFAGLNCDREKLYERINQRVEEMFKAGLLEEIKSLEAYPDRFMWQSMQAIGYKEFARYYNRNENEILFDVDNKNMQKTISDCSANELELIKENIKKDTRNYAKRQLTWFRRYKNITWFDCLIERDEALDFIGKQLEMKA